MTHGKNLSLEFLELAEEWGQYEMTVDEAAWVVRRPLEIGWSGPYVSEKDMVDMLRPDRQDRW